jgi:hypothetical protein
MPKKGDLMINPLTKRSIKVGGRVWNRLIAEGHINPEGEVEDENVLNVLPKNLENEEEGEVEDIEKMIQEANEQLPPTQHAVRGRGQYKGKLVKRNKMRDTSKQGRPRKNPPKQEKNLKHERAYARKILEELKQMDEEGDIEEQLAMMLAGQGQETEQYEDYADEYEDESEDEDIYGDDGDDLMFEMDEDQEESDEEYDDNYDAEYDDY